MFFDIPTIERLNFELKTYDAVTATITATKNRLCHLNPDALLDGQSDIIKQMESIKGKLSRSIEKTLKYWPIWNEWMVKVPGCGPFIGGKLIMLYYYRFTPICKDCGGDLIKAEGKEKGYICEECGKKAKKDGVLQYRIDQKHFKKVSSWWHYLGLHCDETGHKPKRKSGVVSDWSNEGRAIAYQLGEQFIKDRTKGPYRQFFDDRKRKRERTHADSTAMHRNNMARHETAKLFMSHFIEMAKRFDGEPFTEPYAGVIMGHTNIIEPFYQGVQEVAA